MVTSAIDFKYLLLENYKKLRLSENELAVLFMIDHLINQGNPFITTDLLALKMTLDVKEIDNCLAGLLQKKLIEYVFNGKKTATSLDPLRKRLFSEFQLYMNIEENQRREEALNKSIENIFSKFQSLLNRSLSPVEINRIREWVSYGFTDEQIINALKDALSKGKRSLREVDKILLTYQIRQDVQNDGITTISSKWDKNLEETIKIAQTPWLDDDE